MNIETFYLVVFPWWAQKNTVKKKKIEIENDLLSRLCWIIYYYFQNRNDVWAMRNGTMEAIIDKCFTFFIIINIIMFLTLIYCCILFLFYLFLNHVNVVQRLPMKRGQFWSNKLKQKDYKRLIYVLRIYKLCVVMEIKTYWRTMVNAIQLFIP